jgi:hypothetical protein
MQQLMTRYIVRASFLLDFILLAGSNSRTIAQMKFSNYLSVAPASATSPTTNSMDNPVLVIASFERSAVYADLLSLRSRPDIAPGLIEEAIISDSMLNVAIAEFEARLKAGEAGESVPEPPADDCHCYGVISYDNLAGKQHATGVCLDLGQLATYSTNALHPCQPVLASNRQARESDCCNKVQNAVLALTAAQRQAIANCFCAHGAANGTSVEAYGGFGAGWLGGVFHGSGNYRFCQKLGTLVNNPEVTKTTCTCPKGWLANTTNVDGGVTADGKCKKGMCIWDKSLGYPPDGTPVGTWGFTWSNGIYAWGSAANGGKATCITTVVSPKVCKVQ